MHNLFLVYFVNLYVFQAYLGPSSGGTNVCIDHLVRIILFRRLCVVLFGYNNWYLLLFLDNCLLSWLDWNNPTRKTVIFCF